MIFWILTVNNFWWFLDDSIEFLSELKTYLSYGVSSEYWKSVFVCKNIYKIIEHVFLHISLKRNHIMFFKHRDYINCQKWRFTKYLLSCFEKNTWPHCVIRFSLTSRNKLLYTCPGWMNCDKIWCEAFFFDFLFDYVYLLKIAIYKLYWQCFLSFMATFIDF